MAPFLAVVLYQVAACEKVLGFFRAYQPAFLDLFFYGCLNIFLFFHRLLRLRSLFRRLFFFFELLFLLIRLLLLLFCHRFFLILVQKICILRLFALSLLLKRIGSLDSFLRSLNILGAVFVLDRKDLYLGMPLVLKFFNLLLYQLFCKLIFLVLILIKKKLLPMHEDGHNLFRFQLLLYKLDDKLTHLLIFIIPNPSKQKNNGHAPQIKHIITI